MLCAWEYFSEYTARIIKSVPDIFLWQTYTIHIIIFMYKYTFCTYVFNKPSVVIARSWYIDANRFAYNLLFIVLFHFLYICSYIQIPVKDKRTQKRTFIANELPLSLWRFLYSFVIGINVSVKSLVVNVAITLKIATKKTSITKNCPPDAEHIRKRLRRGVLQRN